MSVIVRLLVVWIMGITLSLAQTDYSHTLEGQFPIASQSFNPINVNFTLSWNETGNRVDGVYTDNFFATSAPVTGTSTTSGRFIEVSFAEPVQGIKTITLGTSQVGLHNGNATTTILTRNPAGVPVDSHTITAQMRSRVLNPTMTGAEPCIVGFGIFSGFCGQYAGTISEVADPQNRCDLLGKGITKLELANTAELKLVFGVENNRLAGKPQHALGFLPATSMDPNLNINYRVCQPLPHTNFQSSSCKLLNLTGALLEVGDTPSFTGSYTITDEASRVSCRYQMTLFRDISY